jgi:hypothetical protein
MQVRHTINCIFEKSEAPSFVKLTHSLAITALVWPSVSIKPPHSQMSTYRRLTLYRSVLTTRHIFSLTRSRVSVVGVANVIRTEPSDVRIPVDARNSLFSIIYRPALSSTQLPVLMGTGAKFTKFTVMQYGQACYFLLLNSS